MPGPLDALLAGLAANPLETVAAAAGILSVWLSTREHIASWPTGIVNVSLYFVVFQRARFYAGMGLQLVYLVLCLYGWYQWKYGGEQRTELRVSRTSRGLAATLLVLGACSALALGLLLSRTDAALPWLDSALASASLVAQWMMTRKLLENWLLWVAADVGYVAMYVSQAMPVTAGLYAVFIGIAAKGFLDWRRSWMARASS